MGEAKPCTSCGQALTMAGLGNYITDVCTDELWANGRQCSRVQGESWAGNDEDMITNFEQHLHYEYVDHNGCTVQNFYNEGGNDWAPNGSHTRLILEGIEDNIRNEANRRRHGNDSGGCCVVS